ncbi:MAG: hypothetical protein IPO27_09210 [Bacteroidetes bacterium]|nr:hypothetical protein [Bacteroidota bacterium]
MIKKVQVSNSAKYCLTIFSYMFYIFTISACKKDSSQDEIPYIGINYTPIEIGDWIIYDVDSTYKAGFTNYVHAHYQIKEVVADTFIDDEGHLAYRIERFRKDSGQFPDWTIYQVWSARISSMAYERNEDNNRFIKVSFPIKNGKTWNGNSKNIFERMDYEFTDVHVNEQVGKFNLDSVATVLHTDDTTNLVKPEFEYEKYAANVGLVYRYSYKIERQAQQGNPNIIDTVKYIKYIENIIDYKK